MTAGPIDPPTPLSPSAEQVPTVSRQGTKHARRAAAASFIGSTLEYYDFFIYGSASALIFNKIFFPGIDPALGTILSMATIGIGYVVRPFAASVIGHYGDRIGRRQMLVLTLVVMGAWPPSSSAACRPRPPSGQPPPSCCCRCGPLQGASAAGESVGAATTDDGTCPQQQAGLLRQLGEHRRGRGIMLASLAFLAVSLAAAGRLLAGAGGCRSSPASLVVASASIRLPAARIRSLREAAKETGTGNELPIKVVLRDHWQTIIKVIFFGLWSVVSSVFAAFGLAYATSKFGIPSAAMLGVTIVTAALGIIAQPYAGILADRIGRKPVFITGNVICAVAAFAYFWSISIASIPLSSPAASCS